MTHNQTTTDRNLRSPAKGNPYARVKCGIWTDAANETLEIQQEEAMRHVSLAVLSLIVCLVTGTATADAKSNNPWNGTWTGSWGGVSPTRVVIAFGNVVQYDYQDESQYIAGTHVSGNNLKFTIGSGHWVRMTLIGPNTATAHYHGKKEADATLIKQ